MKFVHNGSYSTIKRTIDHGSCGISNLDYGVLELSPEAAHHGSFELAEKQLRNGDSVVLVHHPEGFPKQYSTGAINRVYSQSFNHTAHTKGGSSGAPVLFNDGSLTVAGVHVRGDGSLQLLHEAVTARSIVENAAQKEAKWVNDYLPKFGLFKPHKSQNNAIILYQPPIKTNCCF